MNPPRWQRVLRDEQGRVTAFVVVISTAMLAFTGLVLDGGLALAAKVRAIGQAQEAARAGAQALDLAAYRADGSVHLLPDQARTDAQNYLTAVGATGTVSVAGDTVTVTVSTAYHTQLLGVIGLNWIDVTGSGNAQPRRGATAPGP